MGFIVPGLILDVNIDKHKRHKEIENGVPREHSHRFIYGQMNEQTRRLYRDVLVDGYTARKFNLNYNHKRIIPFPSNERVTLPNEQNLLITQGITIADKEPTKSIVNLPAEILSHIIILSNNINGLLLTNRFFHRFVKEQRKDLEIGIIRYYYLHKFNLEPSSNVLQKLQRLSDIQLSDTEQMESELNTMLDLQVRRRKRRSSSVVSRHRHILTVLDSDALLTRNFRFSMLQKLQIDLVCSSADVESIKSMNQKQLTELENQTMGQSTIKFRIEKEQYLKEFPQTPIKLPYMNPSNPKDAEYIIPRQYKNKLDTIKKLIEMRCVFDSHLENIISFFIYLNRAALNSEDDAPAVVEHQDLYLNIHEVDKLIKNTKAAVENGEEDASAFEVHNGHLVLTLLNHGKKKWIKYFFSKLNTQVLQNDVQFWSKVIKAQNWKYIETLKTYAQLEPAPSVLAKVANRMNKKKKGKKRKSSVLDDDNAK
ncbi:unnamed protein product [Ambrosiozyma monospora]|uniref:Unnamed protein product n=1 Tax=Ambrosiozyma monospora TaxID=43982 RepID=A0A9W7DGP8_AMBMO|nr:unnamed protein product [Ambrosiozyma monospora]